MTAPQSPRENAKLKVEVEVTDCPFTWEAIEETLGRLGGWYCRPVDANDANKDFQRAGELYRLLQAGQRPTPDREPHIDCTTCGRPVGTRNIRCSPCAGIPLLADTPAPDAGMPPEPMVELPELEVTLTPDGCRIRAAWPEQLDHDQAAEVIRRCADYALLKSYIQRQGKGEL